MKIIEVGITWNLTVYVLKDVFCEKWIESIHKTKIYNISIEPQGKWELIKYEIRKFCICYLKKIAKLKRDTKVSLETIVNIFETTAHDFTISEEQYLAAKNELENLYNEKIEGQILRSKVQWYEDGEKSSKFFLNLEKKKGIQNTVRTLISDDGNELVENRQF